MRLENKVAIVTGSRRGIGKAIALALAREGAIVVVAARTELEEGGLPGTIHKTAEEIRALGRKALAMKVNVSSEEDVEELMRRTIEEFGRIDILVNNAGVNRPASLMDMPIKHLDLILAVNLRALFLCTKAALPKMIQQGGGSIINLSSLAAREISRESKTGLAYDVTKAGIERFTWGLAEELRRYNIAVNALVPAILLLRDGVI